LRLPGGLEPRPTAVIVIALAVAALVWLLFISGDDDDSGDDDQAGAQKTVEVVSADELLGAIAGAGFPAYWVGEQPDMSYEVTRITGDRNEIYVRYLPPDAEAETKDPYLTVGSYQVADAYGVTQRQAEESGGSSSFPLDGEGIALPNGADPRSVYVAYPGIDVQIEVYSPEAGRALDLVRTGALTPIG
jgi:hypothetical protein